MIDIEEPVSGAVVIKHRELQNANPHTPVEKLRLARDLRRFIEQQIVIAKETLDIASITASAEATEESSEENPAKVEQARSESGAWTFVVNEDVYLENNTTAYKIAGVLPDGRYKLKYLYYGSYTVDSGVYRAQQLAKRKNVRGRIPLGESVIVGSTTYKVSGSTHDGKYRLSYIYYGSYVVDRKSFFDSELARTR